MKRIFITFILALCTTIASAQVKVLGKIEPNGSTDTYPTHVDSLGKGGFVAVSTWQERNSIPLQRRKAGMMVSVKSATVDSLYRLGIGLTNADWLPYVASVDVSGKANLAGGNTFTGVQKTDTSFIVTNPNSEARLEKDLLQFRDLVGRGKVINLKPNLNSTSSSVEVLLPETSGVLATVEALGTKANLLGGNTFQDTQFIENGNIQISNGHFETDGNLQGSALLLWDQTATGKYVVLEVDPSTTQNISIKMPLKDGRLALASEVSSKADLSGATFIGNVHISDSNRLIFPDWLGYYSTSLGSNGIFARNATLDHLRTYEVDHYGKAVFRINGDGFGFTIKSTNGTYEILNVNDNGVELPSIAAGLIIRSPSGNRFKLVVDDEGNLSTEAL